MTRRDLDWMLLGMGVMLVAFFHGLDLGLYALFPWAFLACFAASVRGDLQGEGGG